MLLFFFFFFSSRRRHTRCSRDWSSDVCSSDLPRLLGRPRRRGRRDDRVGRRGGLGERVIECGGAARDAAHAEPRVRVPRGDRVQRGVITCFRDRKSTRLNSSHGYISYAVFCLKKKKRKNTTHSTYTL